uniref:Uncharacterized protein n=1 Tax=Leersia perrieri TaxID=77586 RepID=A0A0D9V963_9ORYZ
MTGVDSCYFVIYAVVLCEMGSLLMVVSGINALGAIALFVILLIQKDKHTKFNNARRVHRA